MPIMASFVHVTTGADTANADDHKYKWMRFTSDDLSSGVKIFQPWLKTTTVGTVTVYSWTDIVALWAEVGRIGDDISARELAGEPVSPDAVARGLAVALQGMPATACTRPQGVRFMQHNCRDLPAEKLAELTLTAADLLSRDTTYLPAWQSATYGHASQLGVPSVLGWLYYYDPQFMRGETDASQKLWDLREYATIQKTLPENHASERPNPPSVPTPADAANPPSNHAAIEAAVDNWEEHRRTPHPDSVDPEMAMYVVVDLLSSNQYQADWRLRPELPEGPPRDAAAAFEIYSSGASLDGTTSGMRSRIRGAVSALAAEGETAPLEQLLDDKSISAPAYLVAFKELAQLLLSEERQKDAHLYTPHGARALNNALKPYAAFLDHIRSEAPAEGAAAQPSVERLLERLTEHIANTSATHGVAAAAGGGGAMITSSAGGAPAAGKHVGYAAWQKAASLQVNAQVLFWLDSLVKKGATSLQIHRAIFVCSNKDHPKWTSTGFLHAIGWGTINAALVDSNLSAIYEYATNHYIGLYLAHMIVAAMRRSNLLTEEQVEHLKGFSLEQLASKLRAGDWATLDLVNTADLAIQGRLAELTYRKPPPSIPYAVTLTDPSSVTRIIVIVKAIFEALGMQRDGDNSVAGLMHSLNTEVVASTATPTVVLAKRLMSNAQLYKLALKLAGRDYHAARGAVSVHHDLPSTNFKEEDIGPAQKLHTRQMDLLVKLTEEQQARDFLGGLDTTDTLALGESSATAASALIIRQHAGGTAGAGKKQAGDDVAGGKRQRGEQEDADTDEKKRKSSEHQKELDEKSRAKVKALAEAFDSATKTEITGKPTEQQAISFVGRSFDLTALRDKYGTDKCWPAIIAGSCGATPEKRLEYARKCCPQEADTHPDQCDAHTLPDGCRLSQFRLDKPGRASKSTGVKGKGGGKGKGKGRGGGKGKGKSGGRRK